MTVQQQAAGRGGSSIQGGEGTGSETMGGQHGGLAWRMAPVVHGPGVLSPHDLVVGTRIKLRAGGIGERAACVTRLAACRGLTDCPRAPSRQPAASPQRRQEHSDAGRHRLHRLASGGRQQREAQQGEPGPRARLLSCTTHWTIRTAQRSAAQRTGHHTILVGSTSNPADPHLRRCSSMTCGAAHSTCCPLTYWIMLRCCGRWVGWGLGWMMGWEASGLAVVLGWEAAAARRGGRARARGLLPAPFIPHTWPRNQGTAGAGRTARPHQPAGAAPLPRAAAAPAAWR